MQLLLYPAVDSARLALIREAAGTMQVINATDESEALAAIVTADAFFGKITEPLLARARNLQWVQAPTASLEHFLFPALVEHPCLLSNMRGLFSDVIADHVLGCVLCFARNLLRYSHQQRRHCWSPAGGEAARSDFLSGPGVISAMDRAHQHLADCTLGIVGVGEIGREVARRASAFGMSLLGVDPQPHSLPEIPLHVWPVSRLPDLLQRSDYVVIAAPQTPETIGLFQDTLFRQMRPTAILINVGRGAIVKLHDLTCALQQGVIAGAALDVFETEPLPPDHPLWDMENVLITPHVAGTSPRIAERHMATLLENIRRFIAGQPPGTLVDKRRWY